VEKLCGRYDAMHEALSSGTMPPNVSAPNVTRLSFLHPFFHTPSQASGPGAVEKIGYSLKSPGPRNRETNALLKLQRQRCRMGLRAAARSQEAFLQLFFVPRASMSSPMRWTRTCANRRGFLQLLCLTMLEQFSCLLLWMFFFLTEEIYRARKHKVISSTRVSPGTSTMNSKSVLCVLLAAGGGERSRVSRPWPCS
jgi:hypothetical protein